MPINKLLKKENYLSMINNAVGTKMFANLWVEENDSKIDITKNGTLSCAVFVTSILKLFDLIDSQKATVEGALKYMLDWGWQEVDIDDIEKGDVIIWKRKTKGYAHQHTGFYIGDQMAISNSWKLKKVVRHSWNYGGKRDIAKILKWKNWND